MEGQSADPFRKRRDRRLRGGVGQLGDLRAAISGQVRTHPHPSDPLGAGHGRSGQRHEPDQQEGLRLSFNIILDGRLVVSEEIQIMIEGELLEQQEPAQTASG